MKKSRYVIIAISVLLIGTLAFLGISVLKSPEYALLQIKKDIEESGIEGLMPHLTDDAQEKISAIMSITENELVGSLFSFAQSSDFADALKSNIKDIEWNLEDVLKGKKKADVILGFSYNDKLKGTIEIHMIYENKDWKISGIDLPKI